MMSEPIIYAMSFGLTGLLIYCLLRFGPVDHSWAQFTKEQTEEMVRLNRAQNQFATKVVSEGPALYKRKIVSHNGFMVYKNGIYAKFCIAAKGKYRFVPFFRISGIYPVEMMNPYAQGDSLLMGLSSWKEIQIETSDYMVFMLDARAHDFQTVMPILKDAMGGQWEKVYRENMPIVGKLLEAPFMKHAYIRGETAPQPQVQPTSSPIEFTQTATHDVQLPPPAQGYGVLLAEESPQDMAERASSLRKGGYIILVMGIVALMGGIAITMFLNVYGLPLLMVGIVIIILAPVVLHAKNKLVPMRMYENGFCGTNLLGAEMFVPYGRINNVTETSNFIDGDIIMMKTSSGQILGFKKSNKAFMDAYERIKPRINDARYDFQMNADAPKAMGGKAELMAYAIAPLLGLAIAFFLAFQAYGTLTMFHYMFTLVYIWPSMALLVLIFIVRIIRKIPKIVGHKPDWKAPMAIVAAMLILFFVGQGVIYNIELPSTSSGGFAVMEPIPTYSVLNGTLYENQVLNVTGPVFVSSSSSLVIRNSTIKFGGNIDKDSSVYVAEGGTLTLDNCTLISASASVTYSFEAHGNLEMTDCYVSGIWGDADNVNYDGGIEIYSNNATLTRVTVSNATANGLFAMNATIVVESCVFENCADDGLEIKATTAHISNTTISNTGWAMVIDDEANVTVTRSIITNNRNGICAEDATVNINNCTFRNNDNYAIEYRIASATHMADNTFTGNEMDVSGPSGYTLILICNMMMLIEAVVCAMFIIWSHKNTAN